MRDCYVLIDDVALIHRYASIIYIEKEDIVCKLTLWQLLVEVYRDYQLVDWFLKKV